MGIVGSVFPEYGQISLNVVQNCKIKVNGQIMINIAK